MRTLNFTLLSAARKDCSSFLVHKAAQSVPAYASACSGTVRYSSACSCWGIALTALSPTSSVTTGVVTTATTSTTASASIGLVSATATTSTSTSASSTTIVADGSTVTGTYQPVVPSSYVDCSVDPIDPASVIYLLDPQSGTPIVNNNGQAGLPAKVSDDYPGYHFVHPAGASDK